MGKSSKVTDRRPGEKGMMGRFDSFFVELKTHDPQGWERKEKRIKINHRLNIF